MNPIPSIMLPCILLGAIAFSATQHSIGAGLATLSALCGTYLVGYFNGKRDGQFRSKN